MSRISYKNSNGFKLESVTTIIGNNLGWNKNVLLAWQAREFKEGRDPTKKKDKAADIGSVCHHYIDCEHKGINVLDSYKKEHDLDSLIIAEKCVEEYRNKIQSLGLVPVDSEKSLVSNSYGYGGTIDLRYLIDGTLVLGDIKTSPHIYGEYLVQVGAYDNLLIENGFGDSDKYAFVLIDKHLKESNELVRVVYVPKEVIKRGFEVFKYLLEMNRIKKEFIECLKGITNETIKTELQENGGEVMRGI